ncbi:uncharacterized protein Dwil_GK19367 [Drosophila willistoni]|uniref:Uncharacterized protein n=1 Tax=Drosophila willistoni TaxID=7260 RepID=B4MZT0_DROWI|nr:uncharacterized protein LOC6643895 [Drosophila willistoni]EDW77865.1 uncharacterized protein Dwil_GK19367 [Drosophila willistoni]
MSISKDWSRAEPYIPRDNIRTEAGQRTQTPFKPSFEEDECPPSMAMIIGGEYARIWLRDRAAFVKKRERAVKPKYIKNDFEWWLKLRKTTKSFCKK